jgi:hypothetical protein
MTRSSLAEEPVIAEDIVQQNEEIMDEKFPEILLTDWRGSALTLIEELVANAQSLSDDEIRTKAHKAAGSTLAIGGHQLGTTLRTVSQLVQSGSRDLAIEIVQDIPLYLEAFKSAIEESKAG